MSTMDRFEEFIRENRDQFESYKPSPKVWEQVKDSFAMNKKGRPVFKLILSRAAAVILIFAVSYMLHEYLDFRKVRENEALNSAYSQYPELKEAEIYYGQMISARMKEISPFFKTNTILAVDIKSELAELDSIYKSLQLDLSDNIANERIIEAMILNYRMRLNILESLLAELRTETNTINNGKNGIHL